ncbi:ArsR/SmtB family transcription factor [Specibacter sp. NPDC057265]|uniref:ArsR/SmtB family transcription factor n=1 Tax=Specibacter sp. NPDC057265 TaxID=3346075 RepID=UPI00362F324E
MVAEKVFAVIAESTRRDILQALARENKAVGQLVEELGVAQPTVSKHLRVLREAGVVTMRAQGQKRFYGLNAEPLALISTWLDSLGAGVPSKDRAAAGTSGGHAEAALAAAVLQVVEKPAGPKTTGLVEVPDMMPVPAAAAEPPADSVAGAADVLPRPAAQEPLEHTPAAAVLPDAVTAAAGQAVANQVVPKQSVVPFAGNDASVQGQIGRSVGRAAVRAADLLANLSALPKMRRKKD